jgi:hypothetical protein
MIRLIEKDLIEWKNDPAHKALLLRGARQVGKTYSIRNLGKTFPRFLEVNLEEEKRLHVIFEETLNPETICQRLSSYFATPIIPGETLLFFDEIQACPSALGTLRFFYEKMSDLHVVAAGSLLEFTLAEIPSQGVGRIHSLHMYPLSFSEFLSALGEDRMNQYIEKSQVTAPLDPLLHEKLVDYLKIYQMIGGLPEVVKSYVEKKDLHHCQSLLDDLLLTFRDDFAKYKKRAPVLRLREVFEGIVFQAGAKFKYSRIESSAAVPALKEALELLVQAGLAYKIYHTDARGVPLGAQIDPQKFKVILFDLGIHQRLAQLDLSDYILSRDFHAINKGHLAEIFTGLELIRYHSSSLPPQLYYWHRESKGSNAEVDYIVNVGEKILPIEVKAGTKGQMQSLFLFLQERQLSQGVRISLEPLGTYDSIRVIPLYAVKKIWDL